jgi:hydrogenase nickel incorporation protein HypA/HybF
MGRGSDREAKAMQQNRLVNDMVRKIETCVEEQHARRAVMVKVKLGADSRIGADSLRQEFDLATRGTRAEGAQLDIEILDDWTDPLALEVCLERLELER